MVNYRPEHQLREPPDAHAQLQATQQAVETLPNNAKKAIVIQAAQSLPIAEQQDVARSIAQPSRSTSNVLWVIVVAAFAIVLVGAFLTLAASVFIANVKDTSLQIMLTVFTSVLGFLTGLFAPSPLTGNNRQTNDRQG